DERERLRRQRDELFNRYGRRWIAAEGRLSWTVLERPRSAEAVEPWIGAIAGLSEAVLRADLEKADDVLNLHSKYNSKYYQALLETLKGELLPQRLTALASLRQTGIPEAAEVLCLLLWELWAPIADGKSKLCDQETIQLQRLLDLMQKAIADWDRVKNSGQIEWCGHFCSPIWSLRQSRGDGPLGRVDYDVALKDLRDLQEKLKGITSRQLSVGLMELRDVTMSLKEEVKELQQGKLQMKEELEKLTSEHDTSTCRMTEMDDKLKKMEHESSAEKELLNMKKDLREVCMKYGCLTFNGNLKRKRGLGEEKRHQNEEASILSSASSGFSVDTGGPCCFMVDAVFETPTGSFLSGLQLSKGTEILAADRSTVLKVSASQLKVGDEVVADGIPTKLTSVDFVPGEVPVLKITFQPDKPVAVFDPQPCIHSHGHKPKKIHRGGIHSRRVQEGADAVSIPDTQGDYSD
ncbi:Uncharacterized protein SCF082_LOCUS24788, partial [Durusdinium trenchii]